MPKIELDVHNYVELGNNGLTLRVRDNDGTELGRLKVRRGGLRWFPKHKRQARGQVTWNKFIEWIET